MAKDITPKFELLPLKEKVFLPENIGFGSTIGGLGTRLASTVSEAINKEGNLIKEVINDKLDTSSKEILGDFTFGSSGAIKMITDDDNGLWISPTGILGKKAGSNTFAIDTSGNATFAGDITGATGTFGNVVINSGTIQWSTVVGTTNAPVDNATVGAILGTNVSGGSTSANYINNSGYTTAITATSITTGTLTVGSSETGIYVKSGGDIEFESTTYSSFSSINFTKKDVTGNQWEIYYTATGGGGYVEGNLVFEPLANGQRMTVGSFARKSVGVYTHLDIYGNFTVSGNIAFGGNIIPNSNGSYDIGSSTYAMDKIYANRIYIGSDGRYLDNSAGTLRWNGSAIGIGTVTSVATTGAITGGTITSSGTIAHSTAAGYKHVPTGGASQQFLKYSSSGTPVWAYLGATANAQTIIPTSGTANLGSSTYYWDNVYVGKINLKPLTNNPTSAGDIVNYASSTTDQFRGIPGDGTWTGSFDMSAY